MQLNCATNRFPNQNQQSINQNQQNQYPNRQSPSYKRINTGLRIHSVQIEQNKSNITNASNVSNTRTEKSNQQRSGSISRGIKVLSRNSSFQKKSNNSIDKNIKKQQSGSILNCYNNQTVQIHEFKSMQTLKSEIHTYNQLLSDRQKHQKQEFQIKSNGSRNKLQDNLNYLRRDMQGQIINIKTIYQNKFRNSIDQLNSFYSRQIDNLIQINNQNQQRIKNQQSLIQRLQNKISKEQKRSKKYQQRFESLFTYVQQSNLYTIQRINQMDTKLNVIVSHFDILQNQKVMIQNKIQYLFQIFSSVLKKLVTKGKIIQIDFKKELKGIIQKYQYFQQKIYQMDLSKNIGKENQIQNIRINQKITQLKELFFIATKQTNLNQTKNSNNIIQLPVLSEIKSKSQSEQAYRQILQTISQKLYQLEFKKVQIQKLSLKKQDQLKKQIQQLSNKNDLHSEQIKILSQSNERLTFSLKQYSRVNESLSLKSKEYALYIKELQNKLMDTKTTLEQAKSQLNLSFSQKNMNQLKQLKEQFVQTEQNGIFSKEQIQNQLRIGYQNSIKNLQIKFEIQEEQMKRFNQEYIKAISQNQELQKALQYSQHMFDSQMTKYKQRIQDLITENQTLKTNQKLLQESRHSNMNQETMRPIVKLCKSPKKQNLNFKNLNWKNAIIQNQSTQKQKQIQKRNKQNLQIQYKKNIKQVLEQSPSYDSQQNNQLDEELYSFNKISKTQSAQSYYPQPMTSQKSFYQSQTSIMKSHSNIMKYSGGNLNKWSQKQQKGKIMTKKSFKLQKLRKILQFYSNRLPVRCEIDYTGYLKYYESGKYVMDQNEECFELNQQEIRLAIQSKLILL